MLGWSPTIPVRRLTHHDHLPGCRLRSDPSGRQGYFSNKLQGGPISNAWPETTHTKNTVSLILQTEVAQPFIYYTNMMRVYTIYTSWGRITSTEEKSKFDIFAKYEWMMLGLNFKHDIFHWNYHLNQQHYDQDILVGKTCFLTALNRMHC